MEPELPPIYRYFMALVILQIRGLYSEQFTVSSSWSHQVVTVGGQAELSCQISPPQNANHMDVGWFRDHYTQMIRTHKDGREITEKNIQNSKDRTVVLKDDLGTGKMILQIHNITVSDGGKYYCFFKDGHTYEEASTDLSVAAVGLEIQISVQVSDTNGFLLECASGGWFPQPTMQLRDSMGQIIPHPSKIYSEDNKTGLFHSKMSILLKNSTQNHVICCFRNSLTGQEKKASIFLSDVLFKSEYMSMMSNKIQYPLIYLIIVHSLLIFQLMSSSSQIGSWYYILFESLPFLLLTGIFPTYLKFKNEVSDADSLYLLHKSWMSDICWILNTLMIFFTILIFFLLYSLRGFLHNDINQDFCLNQRAPKDLNKESMA